MSSFFGSGKRNKFAEIKATVYTNPTFYVFKIRIPLDAMCCQRF